MSWGAYIQSGQQQEIEQLGCQLSLVIDCPVHYPAYNKPIFECKCGVTFLMVSVKEKMWEDIWQKHNHEREFTRKALNVE